MQRVIYRWVGSCRKHAWIFGHDMGPLGWSTKQNKGLTSAHSATCVRAIGLQRRNIQEMEADSGICRKRDWGLKIFMSTDFQPMDIKLHRVPGTRKLNEVSLASFLMSPDKSCFHFQSNLSGRCNSFPPLLEKDPKPKTNKQATKTKTKPKLNRPSNQKKTQQPPVKCFKMHRLRLQ